MILIYKRIGGDWPGSRKHSRCRDSVGRRRNVDARFRGLQAIRRRAQYEIARTVPSALYDDLGQTIKQAALAALFRLMARGMIWVNSKIDRLASSSPLPM